MRLKLGQVLAGAEQKHAAVPVIVTAGHVTLGHRCIGFFDKRGHLERALAHRRPALDIAITRLGPVRHNAKGHQSARLGQGQSGLHSRLKRSRVLNHVVGRQHQHQRICPRRSGLQSGQSHRRRCVASGRFQNNVALQCPNLTQLLGH